MLCEFNVGRQSEKAFKIAKINLYSTSIKDRIPVIGNEGHSVV
jgi:hypothetical protein